MHRCIHAYLETHLLSAAEVLVQQRVAFISTYLDDHFDICMVFHLNHDDHVRLLMHLPSRPN